MSPCKALSDQLDIMFAAEIILFFMGIAIGMGLSQVLARRVKS